MSFGHPSAFALSERDAIETWGKSIQETTTTGSWVFSQNVSTEFLLFKHHANAECNKHCNVIRSDSSHLNGVIIPI